MNFIYVIHLMCWNYLVDLITQNTKINIRSNSNHWNNKGASRAPPLLYQFLLMFWCDCFCFWCV